MPELAALGPADLHLNIPDWVSVLRVAGRTSRRDSQWNGLRIALIVLVPRVIFVHQHGRADFVLVALFADNPDKVWTGNFELVSFTQLEQFFKVSADHWKILRQEVRKWYSDKPILSTNFS